MKVYKITDELSSEYESIPPIYGTSKGMGCNLAWLKTLVILKEKQVLLDELNEKVEVNGVLIPKKLFTRDSQSRTCPVCSVYSFDPKDDVYMKKFECCYNCYIQWVHDREERWKTGWRPNNGNNT